MMALKPEARPADTEPPIAGFSDHFSTDRAAGQVVGQPGPAGLARGGADVEGVISIDNGALRIQPTRSEGWGHTGIAYGPFPRRAGLALGMAVLNGHNTSQSGTLNQSLKRRLLEWAQGTRLVPLPRRLWQWLLHGRKRRTLQLWRRWWAIYRRQASGQVPTLDENLALGWFPSEVPADPRSEGNSFVMHATGAENGEMWARVAGRLPALVRGVQNVPHYYVILLRERGAAYYAAAVPDVAHLPSYPAMRPLAIDAFDTAPVVYAGLHQSVMGQIGFRADTRVQAVQAAHCADLRAWYGTAAVADRLDGAGPLEASPAEAGAGWHVLRGDFRRGASGCLGQARDNLAVIEAEEAVGLLHVLLETQASAPEAMGLVWRFADPSNYWTWIVSERGSEVRLVCEGQTHTLAADEQSGLQPGKTHSLQVLDSGTEMRLIFDGRLVTGQAICDARLRHGRGLGLASSGESHGAAFRDLEAHPMAVPVPRDLNLGQAWVPRAVRDVVVCDDFAGPAGDLAGRTTPVGRRTWQREMGRGVVALTGQGGAQVQASLQQPNPGRTAYTLPWDDADYADLALEFTPPGAGPGTGHKSRVGFILVQDPANFITISTYVDDQYGGSSFAFFYHLNGFEELYDAIWSNVGRTVTWGKPVRARAVCQGVQLAVYLNDVLVLQRSLTDVYPDIHNFRVHRVGLVVNWEWGDDTGTQLWSFSAARGGSQ